MGEGVGCAAQALPISPHGLQPTWAPQSTQMSSTPQAACVQPRPPSGRASSLTVCLPSGSDARGLSHPPMAPPHWAPAHPAPEQDQDAQGAHEKQRSFLVYVGGEGVVGAKGNFTFFSLLRWREEDKPEASPPLSQHVLTSCLVLWKMLRGHTALAKLCAHLGSTQLSPSILGHPDSSGLFSTMRIWDIAFPSFTRCCLSPCCHQRLMGKGDMASSIMDHKSMVFRSEFFFKLCNKK